LEPLTETSPTPDNPLRRARDIAGRALRAAGLRHNAASEAPAVGSSADSEAAGPLAEGLFVNPIAEGADPCVVRDGDRYLWCQSEGNVAVAIWTSDRLTSLGEKHVVWSAPEQGSWSKEVWAPDLVKLDGRWHIYFAASDGLNANHLAYVLVADTDDPLGSYSLHGPLNTGDGDGGLGDNAWAIDMAVLEHEGRRYALWSGWPDATTQVQHLYIAAMDSPVSLAGPRVQLFSPFDYPWERIRDKPGAVGINEAPQPLVHGGRTFVVYSCGSALLPSYKLGMLELVGSDPLDLLAWHKMAEPVFSSTETTFGVGHGGFLPSPDGSEWWHVYHAKIARPQSFRRAIQVQPMSWSAVGTPELGQPVAAGVALAEPSGTPRRRRRDPAGWSFASASDGLGDFDYYGHHQFFSLQTDGLHLGEIPACPVNDYRSGEKVVLRGGDFSDVRVDATFSFVDGRRAVGILFRVTGPSVGFNAQRGYFAAVVPRTGRLVLGRTDGRRWTELAATTAATGGSVEHTLIVQAVGTTLSVWLEADPASRIRIDHDVYRHGSVGLRVIDTHARFTSMSVRPLDRAGTE
jgi:GH43 family beta-xylosidase